MNYNWKEEFYNYFDVKVSPLTGEEFTIEIYPDEIIEFFNGVIKKIKKQTFEEAKIAIQCSLNPLEDIEKEIKKYEI